MKKVFIDGSAGTTGLKIFERFQNRADLELLTIPEADRKNLDARIAKVCEADISFLCLPDAASREICEQLPQTVRLLDTSTAHRTLPDWVYGLPELSRERRAAVAAANRVAVPGCHATGFITLAAPLVSMGIAAPDYPFTAHSVTGYSGGGKSMIAAYEAEDRPDTYDSPRQYALGQKHKHLPRCRNCRACLSASVQPHSGRLFQRYGGDGASAYAVAAKAHDAGGCNESLCRLLRWSAVYPCDALRPAAGGRHHGRQLLGGHQ